jgi:pyridoxine 5-phosphate synthase
LAQDTNLLPPIVAELRALGVRVSLFVEPNLPDVRGVARLGTHRRELYIEDYARAFGEQDYERELQQYCDAARVAGEQGLAINTGHDLNLENIAPLKFKIPLIAEVSIGHALTVDALRKGFSNAVSAYVAALESVTDD